GDYTAAAVSSFSAGEPHATVDGNVYRVLARWFDLDTPTDTPANTMTGTAGNTAAVTTQAATNTQSAATPTAAPASTGNVIPAASSTFNTVSNINQTAWTEKYGSITATIDKDGYNGTKCLKFTKSGGSAASFHTAAIDLIPFVKTADSYVIRFYFKVTSSKTQSPFHGVIRTDQVYSFSQAYGSNTYADLATAPTCHPNEWTYYEDYITVTQGDLNKAKAAGAFWRFGFHMFKDGITAVYVDNFEVVPLSALNEKEEKPVTTAKTWVAEEIVLLSSKTYNDPYRDVDVSLVLTKGSTTLTVPGFWDGGNVWRVRFACPSAGEWSYKTVCTNTADKGLHNRTGKVTCTPYSGSLDIYKRGFVKTVSGKTYFLYDDGTPFFYLGDTHWSLSGEPVAQVRKTADARVSQGFTVIQSEPLSAAFKMDDGISSTDILGLRANDERFAYIAKVGLVHANAQFFFPSEMESFINLFGGFTGKSAGTAYGKTYREPSDSAKKELERLSRYWVARYCAYPVMWTLGQEIDRDFYAAGTNRAWCYLNNPYKLVAQYIAKYDPYKHPLTGHQEDVSYTKASNSSFRDVTSHTWYAAQWSQKYDTAIDYAAPRDFWNNNQGKPVVLYESRYCYLWTKNFGARVQGWMAFLNGMCGYGWGGQDTWSYLNPYNENADSEDGVDTITAAEKQAATWEDSLKYESCFQVGYMRTFFEKTVGDWYSLIPRFGSSTYMTGNTTLFMLASNAAHTKIVVYFYNFSDSSLAEKPNSTAADAVKTGTLKNLTPGAQYHYRWFDPVTGKTTDPNTFTASASGTWAIGSKSKGDMVLYVYR
ncbi:MAG: DUF4038 domain-containing protein, partial [Clostridia bacterium]|nr:DUF4038 domain-containing protein [Clostridia bacterium]